MFCWFHIWNRLADSGERWLTAVHQIHSAARTLARTHKTRSQRNATHFEPTRSPAYGKSMTETLCQIFLFSYNGLSPPKWKKSSIGGYRSTRPRSKQKYCLCEVTESASTGSSKLMIFSSFDFARRAILSLRRLSIRRANCRPAPILSVSWLWRTDLTCARSG